jgi:hypothetical protein
MGGEHEIDSANRYPAAVMVTTNAFMTEGGEVECSGVLVAPRAVLTAASCVCTKRQPSASSPDAQTASGASACTASTAVTFVSYEASAPGQEVLSEENELADAKGCSGDVVAHVIEYHPRPDGGPGSGASAGLRSVLDEFGVQTVVPHQDFKMVYHQDSGIALFRQVDLAILVLERPVAYLPQSTRLAQSKVQIGDRVGMVGYGFARISESRTTEDHRAVGDSVIVDILGRGPREAFYAREELNDGGTPSRIFGGDSGGPCFSKADSSVLVGIATGVTATGKGKEESIFTSVFPHKAWIKDVAEREKERVY